MTLTIASQELLDIVMQGNDMQVSLNGAWWYMGLNTIESYWVQGVGYTKVICRGRGRLVSLESANLTS